ncbi:hypothetical protein NDN08_003762 [Rhodosorus marinus]|uniref:TATA-binding protein interacting (TIP20) domain-containing protein n=1 Tax=Rhodosorus marinus TaxID=101924 RepID=A0AAV8UKF5_9RHOD|nr:hypothetical protein NDN08_003762 [Rhodosorus marinus]
MAMVFTVRETLEKMQHTDPDLRYMALSDLKNELKNGLKPRKGEKELIQRYLFELLDDPTSDVQGMAIQCLPLFITEAASARLAAEAVSKLCELLGPEARPGTIGRDQIMSDSDIQLSGSRTIQSIAFLLLKSTLDGLPVKGSVTIAVVETLAKYLMSIGLSDSSDSKHHGIRVDSLELLRDMLAKFQSPMAQFYDDIARELLGMIDATQAIRRKAAACIATLSTVCSSELLATILSELIDPLSNQTMSTDKLSNRIQYVGTITKSSAHKMEPEHLSIAMDVIFSSMADLGSDDLDFFEACLLTLESIAAKNPSEFLKKLDPALELLTRCAKYDPNYMDGGDDVEDDDESMFDEDSDNGLLYESDDDDMSWKVRRAALRCVRTIVWSRIMPVDVMYNTLGLLLLSRLREREENVRVDLYATFADVLKEGGYANKKREVPGDRMVEGSDFADQSSEMGEKIDSIVLQIREAAPRLASTVKKDLAGKPGKAALSTVCVLLELASIDPEHMAGVLTPLIPELESCITEQNVQVKSSILVLVSRLHLADVSIVPFLNLPLRAVEDRFYKITAQALQLCAKILSATHTGPPDLKASTKNFTLKVHEISKERVVAAKQDSEVRQAAIEVLGVCVANYAEVLGNQTAGETVGLLCRRLNSDVTVLAALKEVDRIAESPMAGLLLPMVQELETTVTKLLRQKNVDVRRAALQALLDLVPDLPRKADTELLREVSKVMTEDELRSAALAMAVVTELVSTRKISVIHAVADLAWDPFLKLASSSLPQGQILEAMSSLLKALAENEGVDSALPVTRMLSDLSEIGVKQISDDKRLNAQSTATCVSVLVRESRIGLNLLLTEDNLSNLQGLDMEKSSSRRIFLLACIADLGRSAARTSEAFPEPLQEIVLKILLDSNEEGERSMAALALGAICSNDRNKGIKFFIDLIREIPEKRYLLLTSLKETMIVMEREYVVEYGRELLPILLAGDETLSDASDANGASTAKDAGKDSLQTATAECLGQLASADPSVLDKLEQIYLDSSKSAMYRAPLVLALKYAVLADRGVTLDERLSQRVLALENLLPGPETIEAAEAPVVRAAVLALDAVMRTRPAVLIENSSRLFPRVYQLMKRNHRLEREIDRGLFLLQEDDGLDIRKVAFVLMGSVLARAPRLLDVPAYTELLASGLTDDTEVRVLAQLGLIDILRSPCSLGVLPCLGKIVEALTQVLGAKVKENAVVQEIERHEESLRGALRVVYAMEQFPAASSEPSFVGLMNDVVKTPAIEARYEKLLEQANPIESDHT